MTNCLESQHVLVIGGAKFLGKEIVRAAANHGAHVIIGARDQSQAETVAQQLPDAQAVYLDIADEKSIQAAAETLNSVDHVVITA